MVFAYKKHGITEWQSPRKTSTLDPVCLQLCRLKKSTDRFQTAPFSNAALSVKDCGNISFFLRSNSGKSAEILSLSASPAHADVGSGLTLEGPPAT